MLKMSTAQEERVIPDIVLDPSTNKKYIKGQFLGKGGFAKCYELTDSETGQRYAGKIVSKELIKKDHQKEKMIQEIAIHRELNHKHVVGFHLFFEDDRNVYILLELCKRRSLLELHKRRKTITEPESRYFLHQIVLGCKYLHDAKIIHRDLKLGNLFLNDTMDVKIGDFGLATKVGFDGERKMTLCGTPNYLAPEVLGKIGHSFEVDAWSIGCILYTFLLGRPPFETANLKETYNRIKKNQYDIPTGRVSRQAKSLIEKLLQSNPALRPNMDTILQDEFLTKGYLPKGLPTSCLSIAPRFDVVNTPQARPLVERNNQVPQVLAHQPQAVAPNNHAFQNPLDEATIRGHLFALTNHLNHIKASRNFGKLPYDGVDLEDPASVPVFWVSRWVDYTDKYGLGYQLCDKSVGVCFNDLCRIILASNGDNVQYVEKNGREQLYNMREYPESIEKRIILLKYFKSYMKDHLMQAGGDVDRCEDMSRLPFMEQWFRGSNATVLFLSNGTLQINFADHIKLILCPLMEAVTILDNQSSNQMKTFKFSLISEFGCSKDLSRRLLFAGSAVGKLLNNRNNNNNNNQM